MTSKMLDWKHVCVAVACAIVVSAATALPVFGRLHALDIDVLHAIRQALPARGNANYSPPVAVVAIDEFTYKTAPFAGLPKVMWTPQIASVQDALLDAGAAVIGWDVILPTSAATYVADRNFDRPLLQSLARGGKDGKIVLGIADIGTTPIKPHALFSWAVGGSKNLRHLNVVPDPDGVVRRVPVSFGVSGEKNVSVTTPSLAKELSERKLQVLYERQPGGGLTVSGKPVPGVAGDAVLLNFNAKAQAVPTYSLADLHACKASGNTEFFADNFSGKIVLLGLVLDIEDRKLSSARLFTDGGPPGPVLGCMVPASKILHQANDRSTLPGVYLHATAISNLLHGDGFETLPDIFRHALTFLVSLLAALAAALLSLTTTIVLVSFGAMGWVLSAVFSFEQTLVLPMLLPLVAAFMALSGVFAIRFAFIDKDARFLRKAFASYMAPSLVEQLVHDPERLTLGGERRELTFLFTDLAGFTSLIEQQQPEEAVDLLNDYLAEMVSIAKQHGGTLDKVVGDALHVIFAAPLEQADHAIRAVSCALEMDRFANAFSERQKAMGVPFGETRIGINTGVAIIGNFGGKEFFDYTAHGDAINTAARLESINKLFGTRMAVSGSTVAQCPDFVGRPIGDLVLKGKTTATPAFEPLRNPAEQQDLFDAYNSAFTLLKQKKPNAKAVFSKLAEKFPQDGLTQYHLNRLKAGDAGTKILLTVK